MQIQALFLEYLFDSNNITILSSNLMLLMVSIFLEKFFVFLINQSITQYRLINGGTLLSPLIDVIDLSEDVQLLGKRVVRI